MHIQSKLIWAANKKTNWVNEPVTVVLRMQIQSKVISVPNTKTKCVNDLLLIKYLSFGSKFWYVTGPERTRSMRGVTQLLHRVLLQSYLPFRQIITNFSFCSAQPRFPGEWCWYFLTAHSACHSVTRRKWFVQGIAVVRTSKTVRRNHNKHPPTSRDIARADLIPVQSSAVKFSYCFLV